MTFRNRITITVVGLSFLAGTAFVAFAIGGGRSSTPVAELARHGAAPEAAPAASAPATTTNVPAPTIASRRVDARRVLGHKFVLRSFDDEQSGPFPRGVMYLRGGGIGERVPGRTVPEVVVMDDNGWQVIWLLRVESEADVNRLPVTVVDVVDVGRRMGEGRVEIDCEHENGSWRDDIVGYSPTPGVDRLEHLAAAWTLDPKAMRLRSTSPEHVWCENTEFIGDDSDIPEGVGSSG